MSNELTSAAALRFLKDLENTLGWLPRNRKMSAAKLLREMEADRRLYTWDNLTLAMEYLRRQRRTVKSPTAILLYVKPALELANAPVASTDLQTQIEQALTYEHEHHGTDWERWVGRLVRARGEARAEVWAEWQQARNGVLT